MNTKLLSIIACLALLYSCGNSKEKSDLNKAIDGFSNLKKIADEAEKMEEETDKLLKTPLISKELLKNLFPESLIDLRRTEFSIGNAIFPDLATADATYKNENERIKVTILDGAGETGSALINMQKLNMAVDFEKENDRGGYSKSININGLKAIEEVMKDNYGNIEFTELKTIVNNRFLITLEGKNVSIKKLKEIFSTLKVNTLK